MMNIFHHNNPRPPVVPGEESGLCQREVEGCSPEAAGSPPTYLRWATSLPVLLADPSGVQLFFDYLRQEGQCHADALDFWFACRGLHKENDPSRVQQIIKAIFRRFFVKTQLPVSESIRKCLLSKLKRQDAPLSVSVFDPAQEEVEKLINESSYPNFLRSDVYLSYVRSMQNPSNHASDGSGSSSGDGLASAKVTLATLVEDQELDTSVPAPCYPALTKDAIFQTQLARASDYRPTPELYITDYLRGKSGLAKMYSSYNPVSRQDSELQSLSSDARTESDNLSLTDSSIDGMSMSHHKMTRKQYQLHCRKVKEAAFLNRDPYTHQTVIPRTQRIERQQVHPMKPEQFAAILTEKLEVVKKQREAQEKLDHKLFDAPGMGKSLDEAIWERFQVEDDDGQHILDQHVSRVFSDLTPGGKSPGSPRPRSPELHRARLKPQPKIMVNGTGTGVAPFVNVSYPQSTYQYQNRPPYTKLHSRKEKDASSTFSSDSGNVHDFSEGYDRVHFPKSKSMPDYSESSDAYSSLPGHGRAREWAGSSRNKYRKPPELTDSGVSVVSDTLSNHSAHNKQRVLSWLMENDQNGGSSSDRDSPSPSSANCRFDYNTRMTRSNPQSRGRRSPPCELLSLEEARRKLEDQMKIKSRQRSGVSGRSEGIQSGGSTLRSKSESYTTVIYSFCDEDFPYLSKLPGSVITLKQFKEFLPKKGNYRYFFKTECDELDLKVIQQEIMDDNEIIPLWEGKIMAQVKLAD